MILVVRLLVIIRKSYLEYLRIAFGSRIYVLNNNPYIGRVYRGTEHENRFRWEVDVQLY
jgi:hypothetical protein